MTEEGRPREGDEGGRRDDRAGRGPRHGGRAASDPRGAGDDRPREGRSGRTDGERRPPRDRDDRPARDDRYGDRRPPRDRDDRPARDDRYGDRRPAKDRDDRPARDDRYGDRRPARDREDRPSRGGERVGDRRPFRDRDDRRPPRDRDERPRRPRDPEIPEDIEAGQLDKVLRSELLTLSKDNAEGVARHLVAVGRALDAEDLDEALAHAQAASRRAGRVAGVRETLGVVHYRRGEWNKALSEFRTARRISGMHHLLPLMADAERGLGRPERALELAATPEASRLGPAEQIEMAIVVSGARGDLGQTAAAVQHLRDLALAGSPRAPWAARLRYAYAAALDADGRTEEAHDWYARAAAVDTEEQTDVREILGLELEPELVDLLGDDDVEEQDPGVGGGTTDGAGPGDELGRRDTGRRRDEDA